MIDRIKQALKIWGYSHYLLALLVIVTGGSKSVAAALIVMGWLWTVVGAKDCPLVEWILRR